MASDSIFSYLKSLIPSRLRDYLSEHVDDSTLRRTGIYIACGATLVILWRRYRGHVHYLMFVACMPMMHGKIKKEKGWIEEELTRLKSERGDLRVLEIGCGTGENFNILPSGTHLTVAEPLIEAHDRARKKVDSLKKDKQLYLDAIHELKGEDMHLLKDNTFDAVILTYVLCSVDNVDAVIREIHRVLKPGGKLLSIDHVRSSTWKTWIAQMIFFPIFYTVASCHLMRYPLGSIKKMGFRNVKSRDFSIGLLNVVVNPNLYCVAEK